ncbi:TetR/AcrR family transcriptional regulator, partial [Aquimarina celericrescens]|nr:TetR/AcrR family transcriptional regulator [Aquimarina celericrescens]
ILHKIVINEYSKSYLTKEVDIENKNGYFVIYKRLISRLSKMISDYNPDYAFPSSLASTVLEGSLHQFFLKEHFPTLTDCHEPQSPTKYFTQLVLKTLK